MGLHAGQWNSSIRYTGRSLAGRLGICYTQGYTAMSPSPHALPVKSLRVQY